MLQPTVYIETSVFSYLTARPSRDVIILARQQITYEWWHSYRQNYQIYVSDLVFKEAGSGDVGAAEERLRAMSSLPVLKITLEAAHLAQMLISAGAIPEKAADDAVHIGTAAVHGIKYLLTWNFKHINNAHTEARIVECIEDSGLIAPKLCSPEELLGV